MLQASAISTNFEPVLLAKASRMATQNEFVESLMRYRTGLIQQRNVLKTYSKDRSSNIEKSSF